MFISPKSNRSDINSFVKLNNFNKNNSKENNSKLFKKKLSSRNSEMIKNPKKYVSKKVLSNNFIQFSSNNSTLSNNSNLNNIEHIKKNMNYKKKENSNLLLNDTKTKIENLFQKYKNRVQDNNNSKHNRSLSKNMNQNLVISKMVDKLIIDNINKINKLNLNLNVKMHKNDFEKTFFGSLTTKEQNLGLKSKAQKVINFPKSIISLNNINSLAISKQLGLSSSTNNLYFKKSESTKNRRPNSNDNATKNNKNKNIKINNDLSKSKEINNIINFNSGKKKQKNYSSSNGLGITNNKIGYVEINLFNNGNERKISKEKNKMSNKGENTKNSKKKKNNLKKNDEINETNEGTFIIKSDINLSDKNQSKNDIITPEESHFSSVSFLQCIKNNNNNFL